LNSDSKRERPNALVTDALARASAGAQIGVDSGSVRGAQGLHRDEEARRQPRLARSWRGAPDRPEQVALCHAVVVPAGDSHVLPHSAARTRGGAPDRGPPSPGSAARRAETGHQRRMPGAWPRRASALDRLEKIRQLGSLTVRVDSYEGFDRAAVQLFDPHTGDAPQSWWPEKWRRRDRPLDPHHQEFA
jgi:hypothetical protein